VSTGALETLRSDLAKTNESLKKLDTDAKKLATALSCDNARFQEGSNTNVHSRDDDDPSGSIYRYMNVTGNRCTQASLMGRIVFSEDEDDIVSMGFGSSATFRERTPSEDRELVVRPASAGGVERLYRVNGTNAAYDASAQRWLASFLPGILREGAVNVGPRIARLRAQGGVDAVLRMVGTIRSSGAKRSHYAALIEGERLASDDIDKIVRHASKNLSSSGDLRSVLTKAAPAVRNSGRASGAVEEAIAAIASSGDRRSVLQAYGQSTDRDMLLSVMKLAQTLPSSGDKASLLRSLAKTYLERDDTALREAYFRTVATVPSSGDMRSVLGTAAGVAPSNEKLMLAVATGASNVASSGDRASLLLAIAETGALRWPSVREAYLRATDNMSSGDASRVLRAAAVDRY
jgi:hypothetical protein